MALEDMLPVSDSALSEEEKRELLALLLEEEDFQLEQGHLVGPREARNEFPLSFAQQRLWFLDRFEPGNPLYNIRAAIRLTGTLDPEALRQSLSAVVQRHESLRATFPTINGHPLQIILGEWSLALPMVDLTHLPPDDREVEARRMAVSEVQQAFDLARGPLFRPLLLRLEETNHILLMTMHHIITDGWSIDVMMREVAAFYEAALAKRPPSLPPPPLQYADYAHWQRERLQGAVLDQQVTFWRQQLEHADPLLHLPTDHPRPVSLSYRGAALPLIIPQPLVARLTLLSQQEGATLFMTLLAAFQTLLSRYTGQTDISVGSPIAGRTQAELEGVIGFFVNTLVMRTDLSGNPTFRELLCRVRESALSSYAHQELPFEKLVEVLNPQRDLSHTPLFQVMLVFNNQMPTIQLPGLTMTNLWIHNETSKFELTIELEEGPDGLEGFIEYATDLFTQPTIDRMVQHLLVLLEGVAANPDQRISTLPLLTAAEQTHLTTWHNSDLQLFRTWSILKRIETQVERSPDALAIVDQGTQLTYAQVNQQANQLASLLIAKKVGPDVIVALLAERSIDYLVAMLGILKAGGAFLPLDPTHPPRRIAQVLARSQSPLVITTAAQVPLLQEALAEMSTPQPDLFDMTSIDRSKQPTTNPPHRVLPHNLAYVMFTSGSTGLPKGVMVEHIGMTNHIQAKIADVQMTSADIVAQNGPQCFDISVWQYLAPLTLGGTVYVCRDEVAQDPVRLLEAIEQGQISILQLVPSMLRAMVQEIERGERPRPALAALRWVVPTGDALPSDLCRHWLALYPHIPLLNTYGSTECSDDQCHHPIQSAPGEDSPPIMIIGQPITNMQAYVLDGELALAPEGVTGELHIGGIGVGRGYLNDPARTAEVFIPDPFSREPGARLYKTRDWARRWPDATLEFIGRRDHLLKIRGFRIEPGEIEAFLGQHPTVLESVVIVREDSPGAKRLVAYVVPAASASEAASQRGAPDQEHPTAAMQVRGDDEASVNLLPDQDSHGLITQWRRFLQSHLPEYMVPSAFVVLPEIPLTPNGKLDRKALPAPDPTLIESATRFVAPRTPTEETVVAIWCDVLGRDQVSVEADFFALGGHSLLVTQVLSRIRETFQVEISLRDFFETPTVADIAQRIDQQHADQPAEQEDDLLALLDQLETLSDTEAADLLRAKISAQPE